MTDVAVSIRSDESGQGGKVPTSKVSEVATNQPSLWRVGESNHLDLP
jgi:hypothetical protein